VAGVILCSVLLLLQQRALLDLPQVEKNPHTSEADIALGKKLYAGRCAGCHGPSGDGGKGANLATPVLSRAKDDLSLYSVIRYGLPETEMPSHNMAPREIWQTAAYVRSLGQLRAETLSGDPRRGAGIFRKAGCLSCHIVNGEGQATGPSLTDVGERRSPSYLKTKLTDPNQNLSGDFRLVRLTTKSGAKVNGIWMNEDTWSVQLRELNGNIRSCWKDDLADLQVERRTMMPSYQDKLGPGEMNDVVAYLMGLVGQP
jgi:putative heme-binding domain-containing protein